MPIDQMFGMVGEATSGRWSGTRCWRPWTRRAGGHRPRGRVGRPARRDGRRPRRFPPYLSEEHARVPPPADRAGRVTGRSSRESDPVQRIGSSCAEREPYYRLADHEVATGTRDAAEAVAEVVVQLARAHAGWGWRSEVPAPKDLRCPPCIGLAAHFLLPPEFDHGVTSGLHWRHGDTRNQSGRKEGPGGEGSGREAPKPPKPRQEGARPGRPGPKRPRGGSSLVIVESPTKAKTIGKYLGPGYDVKATVGHLRDLPTRELGVDVERGFEPKYVTIKGKTKTLSELKKAARTASDDLPRHRPGPRGRGDRLARRRPDLESKAPTHRVLFDEITKDAIRDAMRRSGADRRPQGRRAAGPTDPRPARRLQGEPDPVAHHQDRPLRRSGADRRSPAPRRARAGDPRLHAAGVLEHRGALRQGRPDLRGLARQDRTGTSRSCTRGRGRAAVVDAVRGLPFVVTKVEKRATGRKRPARALHHQHAAAGGRQEARLLLPAHHARGAGSLRGHRRRRGRRGRPHHLYADRLGARVRRGDRLGAGLHRKQLRQAVPARDAPNTYSVARTPGSRTPTRRSVRPTCGGARSRCRSISSPTSSVSTSSSGSGSSRRR